MIRTIISEIFILGSIFCGIYFIKTDNFIPKEKYLVLLFVYLFVELSLSLYYKKFKYRFGFSFRNYCKRHLYSSAFTVLLLTLIVSASELNSISRLFLVSIVAVPFILELAIIPMIRLILKNGVLENGNEKIIEPKEQNPIRIKWMVGSLILLIMIFLIIVRYKSGVFGYYQWSEKILLILSGTWMFSVGLTGKYRYLNSKNIYYQIGPYIKSGFVMLFLSATIYYFFRMEVISRFIIFGTILIYSTVEILIFMLVILSKQESIQHKRATIHLDDHNNIFGQSPLKILPKEENENYGVNISSLLNRITVKNSDELNRFLEKNIDQNYDKDSITLLSVTSLKNISMLENQSQKLFMNLHKLNDMRRLNEYLLTCGNKISPGGMLVGNFVPSRRVRNKMRAKMPKVVFSLIYPIHFLFHRVFPKLPKINSLYFILTKGKNRVLSKAEVFGRLSFCGFNVITDKVIDNIQYFIAQKVKTVSIEENPSFSPIVNLKRIGFDGEIITIHKFRTMHPFSEFLQKDLFKSNNLNKSGKFENDFRLTSWGKFMRKFWIDELPQIYDWFHGRVNLIGVRALSEQYFNLYPKDLQQLRTKFKPGLFPPYYADLPNDFEEILESEKRYLHKKQKKPFITDLQYFTKAVFNIVFRGARSR